MSKLILDGTKLAWHKERVEALLAGERVAPITIDCALTRSCTYNCCYCIGKLQENERKKLSLDALYRFLDDSAEIGVKGISFVSDGESTCSPHLYDSILRGKQNGIDMALGTNGYLLQDERLEDILPALTYLRFNISAGEKNRYAEIMGTPLEAYDKVVSTIQKCVAIKKKNKLNVTIGLQMVLMPQISDQVIPLAKLGRDLGVDYLVIKHCSDDDQGNLGIDYDQYYELTDLLKKAEEYSTDTYLVQAKWSKIMSGGDRKYKHCYGAPLMMQFSGSGLVAPCGGLFNSRFKKYHIGNLADTSFKEMWQSDKYWNILNELASEKFDCSKMCVSLCLQHKVNEVLWEMKHNNYKLETPKGDKPDHVNFI